MTMLRYEKIDLDTNMPRTMIQKICAQGKSQTNMKIKLELNGMNSINYAGEWQVRESE